VKKSQYIREKKLKMFAQYAKRHMSAGKCVTFSKAFLKNISNVAGPDPYDLGLPDPVPLVRGTEPDPSIIKQK
jgi:hypothetical protein